jgi:hypothetical protein
MSRRGGELEREEHEPGGVNAFIRIEIWESVKSTDGSLRKWVNAKKDFRE